MQLDMFGDQEILEIREPIELMRVPPGHCYYCPLPLANGRFAREHVIPRSAGGTRIELACHNCNAQKGGMSPIDYVLGRARELLNCVVGRLLTIEQSIQRLKPGTGIKSNGDVFRYFSTIVDELRSREIVDNLLWIGRFKEAASYYRTLSLELPSPLNAIASGRVKREWYLRVLAEIAARRICEDRACVVDWLLDELSLRLPFPSCFLIDHFWWELKESSDEHYIEKTIAMCCATGELSHPEEAWAATRKMTLNSAAFQQAIAIAREAKELG